MKAILVLLCSLFLFTAKTARASDQLVSIDLQNVSVAEALYMLAKLSGHNLIIGSNVTGSLSLHLHDMPVRQAFNVILNSHGLSMVENEKIWTVMPSMELLQQKQDEEKLQDMLNATEPLVTQVWQIRYAKAVDIARVVQDSQGSLLSKRGYVQTDLRTNRFFVKDTQGRITAINKVIKQLDVPVQQVLIQTRLASVDSDCERELGINFSTRAAADNPVPSATHYGLAVFKLANGSMLDVQLAALESQGHGELISSPSLFTANQQPASIESGEEIPYQEISRSGATGIAFKKAVLSLKVVPQVLPNKKVLLQLQINQDKPSNHVILGVPAITTRQITTNVLVANGQTIVLGGIFESNQDEVNKRVPFVSDIPLIGTLFRQQDKIANKRELLVFVTPKIVDVD